MSRLEDYFKYRPFKSKQILLVDNEEDLGWIMRKIFHDAGHRFIWTSTAKEGMKRFKKSRNLDIAIIDLKLDEGSGLTFIKNAKMVNEKVKFIIITAFGTPNAKKRARQLGVRHFLDKPMKIETLLDIINKNFL